MDKMKVKICDYPPCLRKPIVKIRTIYKLKDKPLEIAEFNYCKEHAIVLLVYKIESELGYSIKKIEISKVGNIKNDVDYMIKKKKMK
jgi:hypothetical protein